MNPLETKIKELTKTRGDLNGHEAKINELVAFQNAYVEDRKKLEARVSELEKDCIHRPKDFSCTICYPSDDFHGDQVTFHEGNFDKCEKCKPTEEVKPEAKWKPEISMFEDQLCRWKIAVLFEPHQKKEASEALAKIKAVLGGK